MRQIILHPTRTLAVPQPTEQLNIRIATIADIPFIDSLQKMYSKELGFMPTAWLEGKIARNEILIAEGIGDRVQGLGNANSSSLSPNPYPLTPLGYIIAQDRYLKRDDLGIIYQLVVIPLKQRGFIGAALLKAQFDRSAYGCRLYCCWCAQDLVANHFWESMGFVPLAYRNGSESRTKHGGVRVHIFWEKKIRGNDDACHWWFPSKTDQGALRADRLAFPIPPNVHWKDVLPIVIPQQPQIGAATVRKNPVKRKPHPPRALQWGPPGTEVIYEKDLSVIEKPRRETKLKIRLDPKFIAASRELRDRYLEEINEHGFELHALGKYDLTRRNQELPSGMAMKEPLQIAA